MWAVVPVKEMQDAKQRLAGCLDPAERRALVKAMLSDVLEALGAVSLLKGVLVVTRDPEAARCAASAGARVLDEIGEEGLNAALEQASAYLAAQGARGIVVVPGDVPSFRASELTSILEFHEGPGARVSLVSDRHGLGTNCIACSPPDLCRFHFGEGSFAAHQEEALKRAAEIRTLTPAGLQLDIDTAEDLDALALIQVGKRTGRLLESLSASSQDRQAIGVSA